MGWLRCVHVAFIGVCIGVGLPLIGLFMVVRLAWMISNQFIISGLRLDSDDV